VAVDYPSRERWAARRPLSRGLVIFLAVAALVFALQLLARAYVTERGNYSDEAAHFMNGLLVRDYVASGMHVTPIRFAQDYYLSYPKIAPGMWPGLFLATLGLVFLPGWAPHPAALVFVGLVTALTACRLRAIVSPLPLAPWLVTVLFLVTPIQVALSTAVMIDGLVALFALEATWWLARYFETTERRAAVVFGALTALACLSKPNGMALCVAPLLLVAFTGRFDVLRRADLFLSALIVLVAAAPAVAFSYYLDGKSDVFAVPGWWAALDRARFYGRFLLRELGPVCLILAALGFAAGLRRATRGPGSRRMVAPALGALVVGGFLFHMWNPHPTVEGRYLSLLIAPLLALAAFGVESVARLSEGRRTAVRWSLYAGLVAGFLAAHPLFVPRQPLGYRDAVAFLSSRGALAGNRVLIVSDENGEGAFVAEVAALTLSPRPTILRATKVLAESDWDGHGTRLLFPSAAAVLEELESLHVDHIVVDPAADSKATPFWGQIATLVRTPHDRLERVYERPATADGVARSISIYRLTRLPPGPPKKLRLRLTSSFGWTLER